MKSYQAAMRSSRPTSIQKQTGSRALHGFATWQPTTPIVLWCLAGILVLRSLLALWTLRQGFVEYNADGFSRVIRGYEWLQAPRWEVEVWLPLPFWIYGALLALWENAFLAPKVLNFSLSLITIALVFGIATTLMDRRAGLIAAGLVALFPYEVWLSVSGMSEPLFHLLIVFAVFGFVTWWVDGNEWMLTAAGASLAAATAVRYEGWFYVVAFALVTLTATTYQRRKLQAPVFAILLASSFMLVWMQQNYQLFGDPLAFVRHTEEIRLVEDPANVEAGFLDRLLYFPSRAFEAAPLVVLAGIGSLAFLLYREQGRWSGLSAIVFVQALLFIGMTAPFASLGPGSERFLLSNIILLCIPIGAVGSLLIRQFPRNGAIAAGAIVAAVIVSFIPHLSNPPTGYPSEDTRELASHLGQQLDRDSIGNVVVLLPEPPDERFNEGYALRILSGHPGRVEITNQPSRLYESVQEGEALAWVVDEGTGVREPAAEERWVVGEYVTGSPPPPAFALTDQSTLTASDSLTVSGTDFWPGEPISTWWTGPTGDVYAGPVLTANSDGEIQDEQVPLPPEASDGRWALTLAGQESQRQAFVGVRVSP